jgi:hydroxymethylglutaryl-CoA reductase (NADPH)
LAASGIDSAMPHRGCVGFADAAVLRAADLSFRFVELKRWPRKNDEASIRARQEALGLNGGVTGIDLSPFVSAQEMLTGAAVIPVSVVGPLEIELGRYELEEPFGHVTEAGRSREQIFVPLAHTEGGLSASLYRGARAAAESGGFRTYVLGDRITRASCFVCNTTEEAVQLGRFLDAHVAEMRRWLAEREEEWISSYAKLREVETHVVGSMCHVLWAFTTGDACGPNMMTRNAYALNMGYVMELAPVKPQRAILEANMGGDKKPSHRYFERGGHGKTVLAEVTLTDDVVRRVLRTTVDDLLDLSFAGTHGAVASGMQSVAFTPASAIAAMFAATGQDLGMVGTSSMAHGTGRRVDGGIHCALRLPGLEVGTVGGGTVFPYARTWLELMDCAGAGKVYRFAQIVAAATLSLEISASAAMATAGSENFFRAHHELGGKRH